MLLKACWVCTYSNFIIICLVGKESVKKNVVGK